MSPQRWLDAFVIVGMGVLCAAFVLDNFSLGIAGAFIAGGAAILDDIIRK